MVLEELMDEMGLCGRFQVLIVIMLQGSRLPIAISLMLPSFSGITPDWWCDPLGLEVNDSVQTNTTFKVCPTNGTECTRRYSEDMITIVSQWDLVCNKRKINKVIISVQMAGLLVAVIIAGQLLEILGRKPILYCNLAAHGVFSLIGVFSVSWEMYAAMRFLIGGTCGVILMAHSILVMEFIGNRWRPIILTIPFWQFGVFMLAFFAWLFPNWSHLHILAALTTFPFLAAWFFVPESLRWLTVKGKLKEAEAVVEQIAKYNRREKPAHTTETLKQVADAERVNLEKNKKYSYIDIFKGWRMMRKSLCLCFIWFSCSAVYYGISYNVQMMSGNVYINIVLLSVVEIPSDWVTFFLLRTLGRKWTTFAFCLLTGACGVGTLAVNLTADDNIKDNMVTGLAITAKFCLSSAWDAFHLFTNELYPTVVRGTGFGACQTFARVGGIVAPIILMVDTSVIAPYIIMGILMLFSSLCVLTLTETKDKAADDLLQMNITSRETEKLNVTSIKQDTTSSDVETVTLNTIRS